MGDNQIRSARMEQLSGTRTFGFSTNGIPVGVTDAGMLSKYILVTDI